MSDPTPPAVAARSAEEQEAAVKKLALSFKAFAVDIFCDWDAMPEDIQQLCMDAARFAIRHAQSSAAEVARLTAEIEKHTNDCGMDCEVCKAGAEIVRLRNENARLTTRAADTAPTPNTGV